MSFKDWIANSASRIIALSQPWAGSREFPGIPASNSRPESREWNFSLSFPFPKMGMEFSFPFPFPKIGLEFSTWIPVPEKWEWNLPFPVPVPEVQNSFPLMAALTPTAQSRRISFTCNLVSALSWMKLVQFVWMYLPRSKKFHGTNDELRLLLHLSQERGGLELQGIFI